MAEPDGRGAEATARQDLENTQARENSYDWSALPAGLRAAFCLAGMVLAGSFTGFGALLHSLDLPLHIGQVSTALIWALPGQVVFLDTWTKGAGLTLTALAVTLTAVRLLPMSVLVLSKVRLANGPRWPEFLLAHFIAVTLWVVVTARIDDMARQKRLPWAMGLGISLIFITMMATMIGYYLARSLPMPLAAALVFFTPAFFYLALFGNARQGLDYGAILLGSLIGPLVMLWYPQFDLLAAGLIGGTLAWLGQRFLTQRKSR